MNNQQQRPYQVVPASNGYLWVKNGTDLIRDNYGRWLILVLVYFALTIVTAIHPLILLLLVVFNPVIWGGIYMAGAATVTHLEWSASILFEPLKKNAAELLRLGGIIASINLLIALALYTKLSSLVDLMEFEKVLEAVKQTNDLQPFLDFFADPQLLQQISMAFLIAMMVSLPVMMAGWFAPVLIMERGVGPFQALKLSFQACSANFLAFLVYGMVAVMMLFFVVVSFYIGLIFVGPLFFTSYYCSYEDIFPGETIKKPDEDESNSTFVV